jgi:hypothetical protein
MRVLSRDVNIGGVIMPEGTDLSTLPQDAQDSVLHVGWYRVIARPREVKDESGATDGSSSSDEDKSQAPSSETKVPSAETQSPQAPSQPAAGETNQPGPETGDAKLISSFESLDPEVVKLLAEAKPKPIATVGDAKAHLVANKTFRTIDGIGKASDAKIREALSL